MKMENEVIQPEQVEVEDFEKDIQNPLENEDAPLNEDKPSDEEVPLNEDAPADEIVVSIGDAEPPKEESSDSVGMQSLRKRLREVEQQKREMEKQLALMRPAQTQPTLGKKPSLEDYEYDAEKYELALSNWFEDKRKVDEFNLKIESEQKMQAQQWAQKLENYGKAKTELKVRDFEEAEHSIMQYMNQTQQGIILQGADNPALLVYALGKNPSKAQELAAIKDPVKYAFAIAKLETQLKVTPRKPPAPERTISGTGPVSGSSDSHLERLRAEAEKTGDMTKVIQYKRQMANKARS